MSLREKTSEEVEIKRLAGSLAFSPKTGLLIRKTIHLATMFNAEPHFIHVGPETRENVERMQALFLEQGYNYLDYKFFWREGDPVNEVIDFCEKFEIDLLIAGALNKENILKFFLGSVARDLGRKASCSVLMFTGDNEHDKVFSKIFVEANNIENSYAVKLANKIAILCGAGSLTLVKEVHNPALALSMADSSTVNESQNIRDAIFSEDQQVINELCSECNRDKLDVKAVTVEGKPGFALSKFSRENKADLLVVNAPQRPLGILDRIFTHDIEYILADLPCNLLIAKPRE